jgi:N-acetylglucosaminyldiphosphoundecaprenol N-acetyl-beta-D-mannosaminyltransferase
MPTNKYAWAMDKKDVLGVSISICSHHAFIQGIFSLIKSKIPSYVCFANVHMVMEARHDRHFADVVNRANITAADGKPISLFLNFFYKTNQVRLCGMDMFPALLRAAEVTNKSVFFYGSTPETVNLIRQRARVDFPELLIAGTRCPPFRPLTPEEAKTDIELIKKAHPDMVFVSLGCPKQEKWMAENRDQLGSCLLGLGQAFNVYAGVEKRLPIWMRNYSVEWLFRFYLEPRRLWKRYLLTNSHFLLLVFQRWADPLLSIFESPIYKAPAQTPALNGKVKKVTSL